ncbi:MAG: hypothetical protein LBI91_00840 [Spirochaetaceae bacterium]|nr:hypothetical protein [Spirochaetaceae bacterium]
MKATPNFPAICPDAALVNDGCFTVMERDAAALSSPAREMDYRLLPGRIR